MRPPDILTRIVSRRREQLGARLPVRSSSPAPLCPPEHPFLAALGRRRSQAMIAEIKLGSPRLGDIRARIDPSAQARLYADNGAAAISVVVEPDFFFGSYGLLAECRAAAGLPTLAKDFLVHPVQVEEARTAGADALLLVAALHGREEIALWADCIRHHDMVPLVETHGDADLAKLAGRDWELVGVNSRDLRTFEVDLGHSLTQVERLPAESLKVAESGIRHRTDVDRLSAAGFDAFLVGEMLLLADDPASALRRLIAT